MVAPGLVLVPRRQGLRQRRASELAAPDHQRILEQPALLQVLYQRRRRLIRRPAGLLMAAVQVRMIVPTRVRHHHEPHAALHQPSRHQAVPRVSGVRSRHRCRNSPASPALPPEIQQFGSGRLHPKRQLVRCDARCNLRIARLLLPRLDSACGSHPAARAALRPSSRRDSRDTGSDRRSTRTARPGTATAESRSKRAPSCRSFRAPTTAPRIPAGSAIRSPARTTATIPSTACPPAGCRNAAEVGPDDG